MARWPVVVFLLLAGCRGDDAQWTFTWEDRGGGWYRHDVQYVLGVSCWGTEGDEVEKRSLESVCKAACASITAHRPSDGSPTQKGAPPGCEETCPPGMKVVARTCQNLPASRPGSLPLPTH